MGSASVKNGTSFDAPDTNQSSRNKATTVSLLIPGICFFLAVITWLVFGQTLRHDFVNYDDHTYVYENPVVASGLSLAGVKWAFTHSHARNWHPLTTISHMIDCQSYGLKAGGHHLTNVLLHIIAVVLLFFVLYQMTDSLGRSAFVAAVFAIHPLHVESVAWVAERKDVLSAVFFMLTLAAYVRYTVKRTLGAYAIMAVLFACGLMSKPMLVTLPFVLLFLDYWPLGGWQNGGAENAQRSTSNAQRRTSKLEDRGQLEKQNLLRFLRYLVFRKPKFSFTEGNEENEGQKTEDREHRTEDKGQGTENRGENAEHRTSNIERPRQSAPNSQPSTLNSQHVRLLLEKVPLLALAAGSCIATLLAQTEALNSFEDLPLRLRLGNALTAYVTYLWQMFWPARLAIFYPHPGERLPFSHVVLAIMLLLAITAVAFALRRQRPYLIVGWLWYLVMLVPVIGIVQVGDQSHADRYTYLPQIGLYIALTWTMVDLAASWRYRRQILQLAAAVIIVALSYGALIQTSHWRDSESLWTHTLAVTSNNDIAYANLGLFYAQRGRVDDAISEYDQALKSIGTEPTGRQNVSAGRVHDNLGLLFAERGRTDDAISEYEQALKLIGPEPTGWKSASAALAHSNLGNALLQKGQLNDAIFHHRKALELEPDYADGHYNLGIALLRKHEIGEAITHYERSLQIAPESVATMNNLAWVLATCPEASLRNGPRAIELAQTAVELSGWKNPIFVRTLAAAYAEAGRFDDAIATAQRALQLANDQNDSTLAVKLQREIDLYRANQPRRDLGLAKARPTGKL